MRENEEKEGGERTTESQGDDRGKVTRESKVQRETRERRAREGGSKTKRARNARRGRERERQGESATCPLNSAPEKSKPGCSSWKRSRIMSLRTYINFINACKVSVCVCNAERVSEIKRASQSFLTA